MKHTDPINGRTINVRSVYTPAVTLLQGRMYYRAEPTVLVPKGQQVVYPQPNVKVENANL